MKFFVKSRQRNMLAMFMVISLPLGLGILSLTAPAIAKKVPSQFDVDKSIKFNQKKWGRLTNAGLKALEEKQFDSAEQFFQAAVREASKSPLMSTFMIDSLVHSAEVYRLTDRKEEAKDYFDQAFSLVSILKSEKCPLCESDKECIPVIYGPHSEELEEWTKMKAAELGDFKEVTQKRKKRPLWYCKKCELAF